MKIVLSILLFFSILAKVAIASESKLREGTSFGGIIGLNLNSGGEFKRIENIPICCDYSNGFGTGMVLGLYLETELNNWISLHLRADLSDHYTTWKNDYNEIINVDSLPVAGVIQGNMSAKLTSLGISFLAVLNVPNIKNLQVSIGQRIGFIGSKEYSHREILIEPADVGYFPDIQSRTRNEHSGDIPNIKKVSYQLSTGAKYLLPMNSSGTVILCPEVNYYRGFSSVSDTFDWRLNSITFLISIQMKL